MAAVYYHLYVAPNDGKPVRAFTCRVTEVFATREAASKWGQRQRPPGRRMVRQCSGGQDCPGSKLPPERSPPPVSRPRRYRSSRLRRLRRELDALTPDQLAQVEALVAGLARVDAHHETAVMRERALPRQQGGTT